MNRPTVSLAVPVYNVSAELLGQTLDSLFSQAGDFDLEVVINDDVSSVDYRRVLERFSRRGLRYRRNTDNLGMVGNWNDCIRATSGKYCMVVGHDDILAPGMLASQVSLLEAHPGVAACGCGRRFIDGSGGSLRRKLGPNDRSRLFRDPGVYVLDHRRVLELCLRNGNIIGEPSAVLYRRAAFDAAGGYDPSFRHAADLDFNIRLSAQGDLAYINEPLLLRRIHAENLTHENRASGIVARERRMIFEKHVSDDCLDRRARSRARAFVVAAALRDCLRSAAARDIRGARRSWAEARGMGPVSLLRLGEILLEKLAGGNRDSGGLSPRPVETRGRAAADMPTIGGSFTRQ